MQTNKTMLNKDKWNAVIRCDKNYDGLFYYAVKTTGIFCRPSCKAKAPLKENTLFFDKPEEAIKQGYRACKLCRPDITENSYEPNKELILNIKQKLDQHYKEPLSINAISQEFGISTSHLARLFKQYCGITPNEYLTQVRINKSMKLLAESNLDILEVAYEAGFKSQSTFYKHFREQVGCTPKEYRYGKLL